MSKTITISDRILRTIEVDLKTWNEFKILCIEQRIPVWKRISQLIQRELAEQDPEDKITGL